MPSHQMTRCEIVMLGDGNVGKTALTFHLALNVFPSNYDPTIEDRYERQVQVDGTPCKVVVLDTGQQCYETMWHQWIRDGEGFMIVYSICSRPSFARVRTFHHDIQRVKRADDPSSQTTGRPLPVPILLVGNQCDRAERKVSIQEGLELAESLGCGFLEASALTGTNVEHAFALLALGRRQQPNTPPLQGEPTSKLSPVRTNVDELPQEEDHDRRSNRPRRRRCQCVIM